MSEVGRNSSDGPESVELTEIDSIGLALDRVENPRDPDFDQGSFLDMSVALMFFEKYIASDPSLKEEEEVQKIVERMIEIGTNLMLDMFVKNIIPHGEAFSLSDLEDFVMDMRGPEESLRLLDQFIDVLGEPDKTHISNRKKGRIGVMKSRGVIREEVKT